MKPVICFGEVLWDILPSGPLPGGAPMNVAYHLKKLGTEPAMITRIGNDDYGKKLHDIVSSNGITTEYFTVDDEYPTGLVYANPNDKLEVVYDIVYPSAWDFIPWRDDYTALLEQSRYFVFGSLTSRNKTSRETLYQLIETGSTNVLDINLRAPHFQRPQLEYLLEKCDILKMNQSELELVSDWYGKFETLEDRMRLIGDRFNIQTIIVTMGADGAWLFRGDTFYRHPGYVVKVADTIGSGDGFLAGYLHQVLNGATPGKALEFAAATGAFIATHNGACPAYESSDILQLMNTPVSAG